jgi:hypothetical protein
MNESLEKTVAEDLGYALLVAPRDVRVPHELSEIFSRFAY